MAMFASICQHWTRPEIEIRTSFFSDKCRRKAYREARQYANRMPGVIAVEEIGSGIVWHKGKGRIRSNHYG